MKASIIIPTFNHGEYIANSINSVLTQSIEEIECIVVDDGSTDRTAEVVLNFKDNRLRYIKTPHKGIVDALNTGVEATQAEVIAFQGADDVSFPDRLERCLPFVNDLFPVVYHGIYVNVWDSVNECMRRSYVHAEPVDHERLRKEQYLPGVPVFLKKVWQEKPFRKDTEFAFDWAMYWDWRKFGLYPIDIGLYDYIRTNDSASIRFERKGLRVESIKNIFKEDA